MGVILYCISVGIMVCTLAIMLAFNVIRASGREDANE